MWGSKETHEIVARYSMPMKKLKNLCYMMIQCPVKVSPKPVNRLEWFLNDTAASYMTVNLTRFCDVLSYDQSSMLILGSRLENMQVEATSGLGKLRKLAFCRYL